MSTLPKKFLTPEQYLELDRAAERKSEYFDGEMFAMSGAREAHNLITLNLARLFTARFARVDAGCTRSMCECASAQPAITLIPT